MSHESSRGGSQEPSISFSNALAGSNINASGPLLAGDELVRSSEEYLGRQIPPQFTAKRTLDGDRLERELIPARRHIAAAPLAGDHEVPTLDGWEAECHSLSIGEVKAKVFHRLRVSYGVRVILKSQLC